jgi:molybdate transport system substrate-binding protein
LRIGQRWPEDEMRKCKVIFERTLSTKLLYIVITFFLVFAVPNELVKAGEKEPLIIAAASSLRFAFPEISKEFERNTGMKAIITYGSSGMFTQQIENGAPYDLFASANMAYIERLKNQNLLMNNSIKTYALGRIVLAVNKESGANISNLEGLLNPKVRKVAIANPDHAPYGLAAKEALVKSGLWQKLLPKIVYGENVRQTLQFIQTENAEAGIVALSIADVSQISYTIIDEALHSPLKQALAVIKKSKNKEDARAFISYLYGPKGRAIMRKYGFLPPGESFDTRP